MKRRIFLVLIMLSVAITAYSQDFTNQRIARALDLTDIEIQEIQNLQQTRDSIASEAQIEQNLLKAQLEKLLFPADADMRAIETKMSETLQWRLKVEVANIRLRVEVRKLLGETRWRRFLQIQKELRERERDQRESN